MATADQQNTAIEEDKNSNASSQESQSSEESGGLGVNNPTRDALADGIMSLLRPKIKTLDAGVESTRKSQEELSEQISLLTDQLKLIAAEQSCPIDLDGYVTRLGIIKGKINVISSVLHAAQERLNKVHEQAIKETNRRKTSVDPQPSLQLQNQQHSSIVPIITTTKPESPKILKRSDKTQGSGGGAGSSKPV